MQHLENAPNAGRLIESLRFTGYEYEAAVADLADNSIDADATRIRIEVGYGNGDLEIRVIDNGRGMDHATLSQAVRLGSMTDRDITSDLGKFGMGLVTASLALGRRFEVYTKTKEMKRAAFAAQDVDEIVSKNAFVKEWEPEVQNGLSAFTEGESGTEVVISKIDRMGNADLDTVVGRLKHHLSHVYREFIVNGLAITVNDDPVRPSDPLMLEEKDTRVLCDEMIEVKVGDVTDNVRIRVVMLPDFPAPEWKRRGRTLQDTGFSVLRNDREIASGQTLKLFGRHTKFMRFAGEIRFHAALDEAMGVSFTKHHIRPTEAVRNKLESFLKPHIRAYVHEATKHWVTNKAAEVKHDFAEKHIAQKSKQLITPEGFKERRETPKRSDVTVCPKKPTKPKGERVGRTKTQKSFADRVRFEHLSMTKLGPIFDTYMDGRCTVVQINVDHPYFEHVYLKAEDEDARFAADCLLYSMASAELAVETEEAQELLENQRTIMSSNLRTLLS